MYIQCNIVTCSHNHYCHGNATCISYAVHSRFTVNNLKYRMLPWTCNRKFPFYHWVKYVAAAIDIKVLYLRVKCKTLLYDFKNISIFSRDFNKKPSIWNFTKISPIWADMIHVDRWVDGQEEANRCLLWYAKALKQIHKHTAFSN